MQALAKLLTLAVLSAGTAPAAEPAVTLNGVDIEGVTSQRFENATVVIDEKGHIHIEVKGYSVRTVDSPTPTAATTTPIAPAPPTPTASGLLPAATPIAATTAAASALPPIVAASSTSTRVSRRYFLVTQQSQPDGTQYDVSVFINSQWIREVRSSEENLVMEVTKFLKPGPNKVTLESKKRVNGERHSTSPDTTLRVIVGEGNERASQVMIEDPIVDMRRNAAETESFTEEYSLAAK